MRHLMRFFDRVAETGCVTFAEDDAHPANVLPAGTRLAVHPRESQEGGIPLAGIASGSADSAPVSYFPGPMTRSVLIAAAAVAAIAGLAYPGTARSMDTMERAAGIYRDGSVGPRSASAAESRSNSRSEAPAAGFLAGLYALLNDGSLPAAAGGRLRLARVRGDGAGTVMESFDRDGYRTSGTWHTADFDRPGTLRSFTLVADDRRILEDFAFDLLRAADLKAGDGSFWLEPDVLSRVGAIKAAAPTLHAENQYPRILGALLLARLTGSDWRSTLPLENAIGGRIQRIEAGIGRQDVRKMSAFEIVATARRIAIDIAVDIQLTPESSARPAWAAAPVVDTCFGANRDQAKRRLFERNRLVPTETCTPTPFEGPGSG